MSSNTEILRMDMNNLFSFFFKIIVSDNIDYEITARLQTKDQMNRSLHRTHQFAIVDRVLNPNLDDTGPQKDVKNLQLVELLPDEHVQKNLVFQGLS